MKAVVLVLCTANQCRSPMAEGLLRRQVRRAGLQDAWRVVSAGTQAWSGAPATPYGVTEMAQRGIDITHHQSQPVTAALMDAAGVVLCMTRDHREALQVEFPQHRNKVYLFSAQVGQDFEIEDPIGGTPEDYARCARELEELVEAGFSWLAERVRVERE